jgi:hypothetical protein
LLKRLIAVACRREPEPSDYALCIGVDDEHRAIRGVEQYRIGGLRPDAVDRQQFLAQVDRVEFEQSVEVSFVFVVQAIDERL